MLAATPQSKLVPVLTVDDARDMYSRNATATFREQRKLKGKKLYSDYAMEETIAISSEDEDDMELAKRLRSDPPSPTAFAGMVRVKPEVLTVEEANARRLREEEQRVRLERAATEEPSVRNEVVELRALLLEQGRQRAMVQPPSSAELITQVIQGMLAQGLVMAPPSSFPHLPAGFPPQNINPSPASQQSFSFQHMMQPHPRPYAPVQQVDDPTIWRVPGASTSLAPPPLRPPILVPPHHQRDDPHMFGSADPNPVLAQTRDDEAMPNVEGPQGPGDTSTPNPVDEPMHDEHAEVGLGQRPDNQPLQEQVAADVAESVGADQGGAARALKTSEASRHDQGEVMH
jgi:hypothetical protein